MTETTLKEGHIVGIAGPVIDVDGQDDSEDAADDQEAEWLSGRYDRMDDQLLLDQPGREEAPTSLVDDLAELLDWSETPRRQLIRSRLIDWLVDRDLAA